MNKLKFSLLIVAVSVSLLSCLKDKAFMDVSNTQPIIEFTSGTNGTSDLGNFGMDPTEAELDTAIALNIASPQLLNYPVIVTLKVDPSLLGKYNGTAGNTKLSMLPDSAYRFKTVTDTIPAGHRISRVPLAIFPQKINSVQSYGLPIAIVSATGPNGQNLLVSGNAGVAFYAFIGNPIAGAYKWDFTRYNNNAPTGDPSSLSFTGQATLFTADNPNQVEVASGYYIQPRYVVHFSDNGGVLSNFKVTFNAQDVASMSTGGVTITDGPNIIKADPVNGIFQFQYIASTGSGPRYIIDKYYK